MVVFSGELTLAEIVTKYNVKVYSVFVKERNWLSKGKRTYNFVLSCLIERKRNLRSSGLGPIIKQGDDYTFQQQATVYNNVSKDFKEINDFKAFSRKIKGFYKDKALARVLSLSWVLSLIFVFMSNFAIAVYCCNLLIFPFQFRFYYLP